MKLKINFVTLELIQLKGIMQNLSKYTGLLTSSFMIYNDESEKQKKSYLRVICSFADFIFSFRSKTYLHLSTLDRTFHLTPIRLPLRLEEKILIILFRIFVPLLSTVAFFRGFKKTALITGTIIYAAGLSLKFLYRRNFLPNDMQLIPRISSKEIVSKGRLDLQFGVTKVEEKDLNSFFAPLIAAGDKLTRLVLDDKKIDEVEPDWKIQTASHHNVPAGYDVALDSSMLVNNKNNQQIILPPEFKQSLKEHFKRNLRRVNQCDDLLAIETIDYLLSPTWPVSRFTSKVFIYKLSNAPNTRYGTSFKLETLSKEYAPKEATLLKSYTHQNLASRQIVLHQDRFFVLYKGSLHTNGITRELSQDHESKPSMGIDPERELLFINDGNKVKLVDLFKHTTNAEIEIRDTVVMQEDGSLVGQFYGSNVLMSTLGMVNRMVTGLLKV